MRVLAMIVFLGFPIIMVGMLIELRYTYRGRRTNLGVAFVCLASAFVLAVVLFDFWPRDPR